MLVREPLWGWEMWKTVGLDWSRFPESGRCLSCHVSLCTCGSTYPHITTYAPARVAPWSSDTFPLDQVEETSLKLTLSKLAGTARYWQKCQHFVFRHQGKGTLLRSCTLHLGIAQTAIAPSPALNRALWGWAGLGTLGPI